MNPLTIRIGVFKRVIEAVTIPVKPLFTSELRLFNDQVPGFFSKNVVNSKDTYFSFSTEDVSIERKKHPDSRNSHRSPSLLHLFLSWFLWLMLLQHIVTPKRHKELRYHSFTKTPAKNKCPKLYLHNASYTQPISQRFFDVCVSAAYNWHYVLRAKAK